MKTRAAFQVGNLFALLMGLSPFSVSYAALDKFEDRKSVV